MTRDTTAATPHAENRMAPGIDDNLVVKWFCILAAIMLLVLPILSYSSIWHTFYFYRDDYGQIYNSLRQYHFVPIEWVTVGFRDYFINYPEFTGQVTNLVRPLVNATLMLEGEFFSGDNHGVFLATNHILFVVNGLLALAVIRLLTQLPLLWCVFGIAIFALSPAWTETFYAPSFRTSQLMMLFSLLSFISIGTATADSWRWRLALAIFLQCLSLFGHEIGIVAAPAGAVVWYLITQRNHIRAPWASYSLFLIPIAFLLIIRLIVMEGDPFGIYVFDEYPGTEEGGQSGFVIAFLAAILSSLKMAAFPVFMYLEPVKAIGSGNFVDIAFLVVLLALNAAVMLLFLYLVFRRDTRSRTYLTLVIAFVISLGPAAFIAPQPRFAVIPLLFAACMWSIACAHVYRLASASGNRMIVRAAIVALLLPIFILTGHFGVLAWRNTSFFAENKALMTRNYKALRAAAANPAIDELILVNDRYGRFSSLAMLRMAVADAGRESLPVRVVNTLDGTLDPMISGEFVKGGCANGTLNIESRLGTSQTLIFPNASVARIAETDTGPVQYSFPVRWSYKTPARILNALGVARPHDLMLIDGKEWTFRYELGERKPAIVVISPRTGETITVIGCRAGFALTH